MKSALLRASMRPTTKATVQVIVTGLAIFVGDLSCAVEIDEATQGSSVFEIEEFVVTARKREENSQDVPISLTVLSKDKLAGLQARDLSEVVNYVPNLQLDYNGNSLNSWGIRGIVSTTRNSGQESGIGVYVDGVYVGRPAGFNVVLADVEQVEVLRGPQGSLYGRNTIGGAVNITTQRPSDQVTTYATLTTGNFARLDTQAGISGPISERLSGSLSAFRLKRDGYVDDLQAGDNAFMDDKRWGLRGSLHWSVSDAAEIIFRADYADQDTGQVFGLSREPQLNAFAPDWVRPGFTSNFNDPTGESIQAGGASITASWVSPAGYELTSITARRITDFGLFSDDDAGPITLTYSSFDDDSDMFSQELRLASPIGDRVDYLIGAYYLDQSTQAQRLTSFFDFPATDVGILSDTKVDTQATALFTNVNFHMTPSVTLGVGLRYTQEEKDAKFMQIENGRPGQPSSGLPTVSFNPKQQDSELSGDVTLSWKMSEQTMTYATGRRGVKSGGFQTDIITFTSEDLFAFEPETAVSFEVGFKSRFLNDRMSLNAAVFTTDYQNIQVGQLLNLGFTTTNAGTSTINGGELELQMRPTERLTVEIGTSLLDHRYDKFASCADNLDCDGNKLQFAPDWTWSAAAHYVWPLASGAQLGLHLDASARATIESDAINDPDTRNNGPTLLNGRFGYRSANERIGIYLWGKNLTDEKVELYRWKYPVTPSAFASVDPTVTGLQVIPGAPRMFGVEFQWKL